MKIINKVVNDYLGNWQIYVKYLYDIRKGLAKEILETTKSPIVLIKTDPPEGKPHNGKPIKIFGLTEQARR